MKASAYASMAAQENGHWYYQARRQAIESLLRAYVLPDCPRPRILDIGCGTGGTTARLADFGPVVGIEPSSLAIGLLKQRYPEFDVIQGSIDELTSLVPAAGFDLVSLLGVLCHRGVDDPLVALRDVASVMSDGGWILWGDCVYPCLARGHDEVVESVRRFYPQQMHDMLSDTGFQVHFSSHFLGWGFPVALGMGALH